MRKKVHDMGGVPTREKVVGEYDNNQLFHEYWHRKALALTIATGCLGKWNIDRSRYFRESLPPEDYCSFTYYEKWTSALINLLVDSGLVDQSELTKPNLEKQGKHQNTPNPERMKEILHTGDPTLVKGVKFDHMLKVGQKVRTLQPPLNKFFHNGHTRLPEYASGKVGIIQFQHGCHRLPDSNAHFLGESPEPLYGVTFSAMELWGKDCENPNDEINLDLWHSYLEPL